MNNKPDIHLVLISDQAVPNITPILDERFKPKQVIMLVSPDKTAQAEQLANIYKPRGIKVSYWRIENPWHIEDIQERLLELMTRYETQSIALNVTGGTKPMAIAAYEIFRELDKAIFYIHPEQDRLIWLYPKNLPATDLADRIKLKEYLKAYGAHSVDSQNTTGVTASMRELTQELIHHIEQFSQPLSALNFLAGQAQNRLISPEINRDLNGNHAFWQLVDLFQQAGLLQLKDNKLYFENEDARFMVNGGWLEMYAYACCLNIKKQHGIQDVARSINITRQQGTKTIPNEIDVAFLHNNRLYIIECKTKAYSGNNPKHDEGAEILYKLDSLRDLLGGLQARAMLNSAKKIAPHNQNRANNLKLAYCVHNDLKNLEQRIIDWLQ